MKTWLKTLFAIFQKELVGVCLLLCMRRNKEANAFFFFPQLNECLIWIMLRVGNKSAKTHKVWQKPKFPSSKKMHTPHLLFLFLSL